MGALPGDGEVNACTTATAARNHSCLGELGHEYRRMFLSVLQ